MEKEAECRDFGAHHFTVWDQLSPESLGDTKFDIILNCSPASIDFAKALSLLQTDGTLVQVGIPGGGALIQVPLQVTGSEGGSRKILFAYALLSRLQSKHIANKGFSAVVAVINS